VLKNPADRMDRIYRWQRRIYDLTRPLFLPARDELLRGIPVPPAGARGFSILEVGCGTGRNLLWLSRRYPQTRLMGVDVSGEMLKTAQARLAGRPAPPGRGDPPRPAIALIAGDAAHIDRLPAVREAAPFDAVFFSYSLSMMPEWKKAVACACGLLGAQGTLHLVDFGDFRGWPSPARRVMRWWLARWGVSGLPDAAAALEEEARRRDGTISLRPIRGGYAFLARMPTAVRRETLFT
jgi:S-adenosylmethionine-diacylgycerolhomoserine-N-methlytransferase